VLAEGLETWVVVVRWQKDERKTKSFMCARRIWPAAKAFLFVFGPGVRRRLVVLMENQRREPLTGVAKERAACSNSASSNKQRMLPSVVCPGGEGGGSSRELTFENRDRTSGVNGSLHQGPRFAAVRRRRITAVAEAR